MQSPVPPHLRLAWPAPAPFQPLAASSAHVWALALDVGPGALAGLIPLLSTPERERAARFHFELHRNRFIVGRAVLRLLLGRYLHSSPVKLEFAYGPYGKPALGGAFANAGLEFNLAHSENLALLAVAWAGKVGVDVEHLKLMPDADQLVARFFSAREQHAFAQLPAELKTAAFFNLWTRKEAWLKATGEGIGHLLNQVEVSFLPGEPARLLSVPKLQGSAHRSSAQPTAAGSAAPHRGLFTQPTGTNWSLHHLAPAAGFTGALTLATPASQLHCWAWPKQPPSQS